MGDDADHFYDRLPAFAEFRMLAEAERFVPVPPDWLIAVADVRDSTGAIEAGRYRDVNTVGALCIAALLNAAGDLDIPFAFGGDGAVIVLPPSLRARAEGALHGTRVLAAAEFGLRLSVGIVPVAGVYAAGERLAVAKFRVSEHYAQALLVGGGLACAERLVKSPETAARYAVPDDASESSYQPDYSGYSCRWRDVPSSRGESVSLLVQPLGDTDAAQREALRAVLAEIERTYGDARARHPISQRALRPALSGEAARREAKVFAPGAPAPVRRRRAWRTLSEVAVTNLWIACRVRTAPGRLRSHFPRAAPDFPPMEWGRYKDIIVEASDCQKIDGLLRMVIAGNARQRERLTDFLEAESRAGHLAYGLHIASATLMTCLVFQPNGRQVHFVDGAQGGYALAARSLKARLMSGGAGGGGHDAENSTYERRTE